MFKDPNPINRCKTADEVRAVMVNADRRGRFDIVREGEARLRKMLRLPYGEGTDVERELHAALIFYADVRKERGERPPNRTWPMVERHGWIGTVERLMDGSKQSGFQLLVDIGRPDMSFEAVVIKYPDAFSLKAVNTAYERLATHRETA